MGALALGLVLGSHPIVFDGPLLPSVLDGTVEPAKVFDRTVGLDGVPGSCRAMADPEALKVLVTS